jgi:hypothetical protein
MVNQLAEHVHSARSGVLWWPACVGSKDLSTKFDHLLEYRPQTCIYHEKCRMNPGPRVCCLYSKDPRRPPGIRDPRAAGYATRLRQVTPADPPRAEFQTKESSHDRSSVHHSSKAKNNRSILIFISILRRSYPLWLSRALVVDRAGRLAWTRL